MFHMFGSDVGVFGGSAPGWGCVKACCHQEIMVWEGSSVTAEVCVRCCSPVCHQAAHAKPPAFCPFHVDGASCQRLSRLLSHSSLLISGSLRTCTNHLHKPCSVIPHCLIPRNSLCRHGGAAQVSAQLVSLSVLLSLLSHLQGAEGRKLWKGLHQAHRLSLTFSNPDECV